MEPNFTNPVFEMRFAAALVEDRSKAMPQWCHGNGGNVDTMLVDLSMVVESLVEGGS